MHPEKPRRRAVLFILPALLLLGGIAVAYYFTGTEQPVAAARPAAATAETKTELQPAAAPVEQPATVKHGNILPAEQPHTSTPAQLPATPASQPVATTKQPAIPAPSSSIPANITPEPVQTVAVPQPVIEATIKSTPLVKPAAPAKEDANVPVKDPKATVAVTGTPQQPVAENPAVADAAPVKPTDTKPASDDTAPATKQSAVPAVAEALPAQPVAEIPAPPATKGTDETATGATDITSAPAAPATPGAKAQETAAASPATPAENALTENPIPAPPKRVSMCFEAGGAYLMGWKNPGATDAQGLNPVIGFNYYNHVSPQLAVSLGAQYTSIGNLVYSNHVSTVTRYGLGAETSVTVITPDKVHYLSIPVRMNYFINDRNTIGLGINVGYLLTIDAKKETYDERLNQRKNYQASKTSGYTEGFKTFDAQLSVFYRRKIYKNLAVNAEAFYGLTDVKENAFFNSNVFERNTGFKLTLMYNLFK
jgi:hypothetical protein